jgi:peptidoglycan/xylan/chitin deacetylase (PgdA/CDA1 family)
MKPARISRVLGNTGLRALFGRIAGWSGVLVLNYHRIGDGGRSVFDRGLWSADRDAFADQLRFCKTHFDVIAPGDLPDVLARGRGRYILITFDDGYRDNYEVAFPILESAGVPATFFVTTGLIDCPAVPWWDEIAWMVRTSGRREARLRGWFAEPVRFDEPHREGAVRCLLLAYKAMPAANTDAFLNDIADATGSGRYDGKEAARWWMTWDMLREMHARGMIVGGHTVTHPVLARASRDAQRAEIEGCSQRLTAELGEPMRYFSYPVGGLNAFDANRECLQKVGVRYAFSYYAGYRRFDDWDDYDIRRVPVESYVTADWFRSIVLLPQVFARPRSAPLNRNYPAATTATFATQWNGSSPTARNRPARFH